MKDLKTNPIDTIGALIEKENKRDKIIKNVCKGGWGITLLILLIFLAFTIVEFLENYKMYIGGRVKFQNVIDTFVPFLIIFGAIALIIAILATIAMFLRLRTANLLEIQQRLTNLEKMILNEKG